MFNDFTEEQDKGGGRFGASLLVSLVVYGGLSAGIVYATSIVRDEIIEDDEQQVEFAPPQLEEEIPEPEPEPAPEPEPEPPQKRKSDFQAKTERQDLAQPDEISEDEVEQSNRDLADEAAAGREGSLLGVVGGTGSGRADPGEPPPPPPSAPAPKPKANRGPRQLDEVATQPELVGNLSFDYPREAMAAGIQGVVVTRCIIKKNGRTENCRVLRGHDMLRDAALNAVQTARFEPAKDERGNAVDVFKVIPVRFSL